MKRLALNFTLGAALAALLLWVVQAELLADVATDGRSGWAALGDAFMELPLWALPVYGLLFLAVHVLRTVRWVLQVRPLGERDWRMVLRVCAVGYAAIVLFPFRLGELVRPYLLSRKSEHVGFSAALGTAVVERVMDGLFITGLLFVAVATSPLEGSATIRHAGEISLLVFASASIGLALFAWRRREATWLVEHTFGAVDWVVHRLTGRQLDLAAKVVATIDGFLEGVRSLRRDGAFPVFLALTLAYWATNAFGIWVLAQAFGIPLPLLGSPGVLAVLVVGIMVPSAPGFLGTFQLFLTEGLKLYLPIAGIGAVALTFALVMNVVQLVIQVGFALPFLAGLGLSFGDIFRVQQEAAARRDAQKEG